MYCKLPVLKSLILPSCLSFSENASCNWRNLLPSCTQTVPVQQASPLLLPLSPPEPAHPQDGSLLYLNTVNKASYLSTTLWCGSCHTPPSWFFFYLCLRLKPLLGFSFSVSLSVFLKALSWPSLSPSVRTGQSPLLLWAHVLPTHWWFPNTLQLSFLSSSPEP